MIAAIYANVGASKRCLILSFAQKITLICSKPCIRSHHEDGPLSDTCIFKRKCQHENAAVLIVTHIISINRL